MDRRKFLLMSLASAGGMTIGRGFLAPAFASPAQPGNSPYGPLGAPDGLGLRLPEGFSSRVIKQFGLPIGNTSALGNVFPDGAATFPTDDGGWILVSNAEMPPPVGLPDLLTFLGIEGAGLGGVQAIRFAPDGAIVDAYDILTGSRSNCAGGTTPWGTWLSCEEHEDPLDPANSGRVYECDPLGRAPARHHAAMGHFQHENATIDPVRQHVYQTEDLPDGYFYRFTPSSYPDLSDGLLEAARVAEDGSVTWLEIADPECSSGTPCRQQVVATRYNGGEGCVYDDGKVFFNTKGDDRIWVYDVEMETVELLYYAGDFTDPVLTGVDHMITQPGTGNILVAEDGGNMQAVMITRDDFALFPILQMTGIQHGVQLPPPFDPIPVVSEVTGLAFNPAGDRLYASSQRGLGGGTTYEIRGPWLEKAQPAPPTATTAPPAGPTTTPEPLPALPRTGGGSIGPLAVGTAAGAAGLMALRRRLDQRMDSAIPSPGLTR